MSNPSATKGQGVGAELQFLGVSAKLQFLTQDGLSRQLSIWKWRAAVQLKTREACLCKKIKNNH